MMLTAEQQYLLSLRTACDEVRLDFFPQAEASELLYKVITLEDIYLPLTLSKYEGVYRKDYMPPLDPTSEDLDRFISLIDEKIAKLDAAVTAEKDKKEANETAEEETDASGLRLLLRAAPGAGKTTFCKRMILAYLNQDPSFFSKYREENDLHFNPELFPVLVNCKNILSLSAHAIANLSFPELIHTLCGLGMPGSFLNIPEEAFEALFLEKTRTGLFLILDGWDEILDAEKSDIFAFRLDQFLLDNPNCDFMLTIRTDYFEPQLEQPFTSMCIKDLTNDDVRKFCQKWCEIILSGSQKKDAHHQIAEQIIGSTDPQVELMRKNALDLSLLLTVCKNDGRLPDNKADLFKDLLDLYIYWSTRKSTGILSQKSLRVFLAYIAVYFTKHDLLTCNAEQLSGIIRQCVTDLEWSFSEDMSQIDVDLIVKELSHTGILSCTFVGKTYTFAGTRDSTHRQMQEYLSAYAILAQYADEEYNNMSPVEIFEDKYSKLRWREIILFVSLMDNARVRHEIIRRLIAKANENPDDQYDYTNLLFELVVNGADIRMAEKYKIYDLLFKTHITDQQIANIIKLARSDSRVSTEFFTYISEKCFASAAAGSRDYSYAKAMVDAAQALKHELSPFDLATQLLTGAKEYRQILIASRIIILMAWCKYSNIKNDFTPHFAHYRLSPAIKNEIRKLLSDPRFATDLLNCLKESILAGFTSFQTVFFTRDVHRCFEEIETSEHPEPIEIILSMISVFEPTFSRDRDISAEVRERYLRRLEKAMEKKDPDTLIFDFSLCVALGCWSADEQEAKWADMESVYSQASDGSGSMGKARFSQLKKDHDKAEQFQRDLLALNDLMAAKGLLSPEGKKPEESWCDPTDLIAVSDTLAGSDTPAFTASSGPDPKINAINAKAPAERWKLQNRETGLLTYTLNGQTLAIHLQDAPLSEDASDFLGLSLPNDTTGRNNLAYLQRRGEILRIRHTDEQGSRFLTPIDLLQNGVDHGEPFSLVNAALAVSGTYVNTAGAPETGSDFLAAAFSRDPLAVGPAEAWRNVFTWWHILALEQKETEGLVVLLWLFRYNLIPTDNLTTDLLKSLIQMASGISEQAFPGIGSYVSAMETKLRQMQES